MLLMETPSKSRNYISIAGVVHHLLGAIERRLRTDSKYHGKCKQSSREMQAFQLRNASIPAAECKHFVAILVATRNVLTINECCNMATK